MIGRLELLRGDMVEFLWHIVKHGLGSWAGLIRCVQGLVTLVCNAVCARMYMYIYKMVK